jgi:heat shock protein HtpX
VAAYRLALDTAALARQARLNRLQSALLLLGLTALAALSGLIVAGLPGLLVAGGVALALLLFDPEPGSAVFRQLLGGVPLPPEAAPELHAVARTLARRAGLLRAPALYLLPSPVLQAMAAGDRARPAIALTLALLRALPPREVAAILAHEIAHLRHGDVRVMRLAAAASSLTRIMGTFGALMLVLWFPLLLAAGEAPSPIAFLLLMAAPVLGDLLILSLSRRRELLADAGAVELTRDPGGLAAALMRLERIQGDDWERLASRSGARWLRWFRTHPTIRERIARLSETIALVPSAPEWPVEVRDGWLPAGGPPGWVGGVGPWRGRLGQRVAGRWLL